MNPGLILSHWLMEKYLFEWMEREIVRFSRSKTRHFLVNLPKYYKRAILVIADFIMLSLALWMSLSLRYQRLYVPDNNQIGLLFLVAPVIIILMYFFLGVYKPVTRFMSFSDQVRLYLATILAIMLWFATVYFANGVGQIPRSTPVSFIIFALLLVWFPRWLAASLLKGQEHQISSKAGEKKKVIIYGAGIVGTQLAEKLVSQGTYDIRAFIDDNSVMWKRRILGFNIYSQDHIWRMVSEEGVEEIILALPSASLSERKKILHFLEPFSLVIRTLPAIEDILAGRVSVNDIKLVGVEDLLGRDPVPPNMALFDKVILGKVVFVTGAGGSIGSELSRQIFRGCPKKIILFDVSEVALYLIEQDIIAGRDKMLAEHPECSCEDIEIVAVLGSVLDRDRVLLNLKKHKVQIIFHAAAYKHVPLVEANPMVGLLNNVWGTKVVADLAIETGVERFVLVSTDKAVRPTNIMGATKRLAEMYLQALSEKNGGKTVFTMVRFGNVMDSSGSVIQKFRQQITEGGPVTVTDPNIVRFFMSIPEAAELVIQAGAMAQGGEVYILDMGEPVKIFDLAKTMIRVMGAEVRNEGNPEGDIEIRFIGLRPGEKLYEELLIEKISQVTEHPRIRKNNEPFVKFEEFQNALEDIRDRIREDDLKGVCTALEKLVNGYVPSKEIISQGNQIANSGR